MTSLRPTLLATLLALSAAHAQNEFVSFDDQILASRSSGRLVETSDPPKVSEALMPMWLEAKDDCDHGRYAAAERAYKKLLAQEPENPYVLYNQGVVFVHLAKLKSAEVTLKKAAIIAPLDAFPPMALGVVYYRMHRLEDALDSFISALRLDPENGPIRKYLHFVDCTPPCDGSKMAPSRRSQKNDPAP